MGVFGLSTVGVLLHMFSVWRAQHVKDAARIAGADELREHRRRRRNAKTYRAQKRRRSRRKLQLVQERGGRCEDCGYSRCVAALEFHHRDASTKEFGIGNFDGSLHRLIAETQKCDLLCANCHRLRHAVADGAALGQHIASVRDRKARAIALMGRECFECALVGPAALFEFHHLDAATKAFGISHRGISSRTWKDTLAELEKCVMLCANCHREVHAGVRTIRPTLLGLAEDALPYVAYNTIVALSPPWTGRSSRTSRSARHSAHPSVARSRRPTTSSSRCSRTTRTRSTSTRTTRRRPSSNARW